MAEFVVGLQDEVSASAGRMSAAVVGLTAAMKGLGGAMPDDKVAKATTLVERMSASFDKASSSTKGLESMASSLGAALNPTTLAIAAVAAAAALTVGGVVGLTVALFSLGAAAIEWTQHRAAIVASFDALTDGAGKRTGGALDALAARLPFTTGKLAEWSKGLLAAGVRDAPELQRGIRAVAAATAIMGEEGGAKAQSLIARLHGLAEVGGQLKIDNKLVKMLAGAGVSAGDLARQLGTTPDKLKTLGLTAAKAGDAIARALIERGKVPLEELGLTSKVIGDKLRAGLSSAFGDLGEPVKKFMTEVRNLFAEFDKGTATSSILKGATTSVFTTLFEVATRAVRGIHVGMLEVEIGILRLAIAVAPTVNSFRRLWKENDGAEKFTTAMKGLGVVAGLVVVQFALMAGAALAVAGAVTAIVGVALFAVGWLVANIPRAGAALLGLGASAAQAGADFITGLVTGITSGVSRVVEAAKGVATGAIAAVRGVFDSHSPSRVGIDLGRTLPQGVAVGQEQETPRAESAARRTGERVTMALSGSMRGGASGASGARAGGETRKIVVEATINLIGVGRDALEVTQEAWAGMLERVALESGLVTT